MHIDSDGLVCVATVERLAGELTEPLARVCIALCQAWLDAYQSGVAAGYNEAEKAIAFNASEEPDASFASDDWRAEALMALAENEPVRKEPDADITGLPI